ncbi:hypothetical protein TIFTF001_045261 [Ficus carica]|uniref:Uncharacterized protein n=1 Tax=Ficus carica TaxID=3494 RepID=A0AA87YVS3_FICCA|nr:hypothetical protein TIFTF001_045248 [Ficus carica]GMN19948.1 hypothetical protein TIFTF001_045261 [Ficus carica]
MYHGKQPTGNTWCKTVEGWHCTATVKCGMDITTVMVWVRKSFKYDGNKLPRVVPIRTRSGLVHDLNMIAFQCESESLVLE